MVTYSDTADLCFWNLKVLIVNEPIENILNNLMLVGKKKTVLSGRWSQDKSKLKDYLILAPVTRENHVP